MPFDAEPSIETTTRDRMIRLRNFLATLPPEQFDMETWGDTCECGTPACIGGWCERLFSPDRSIFEWEAGALIGLSKADAFDLFFPISQEPYSSTTAQAVQVLDHYLATGEIDWSVAK